MSNLEELLDEFVALVEKVETVEAIERFYAEDVVIFENREIARTGRDACAKYERESLARQPKPPKVTCRGRGVDDTRGTTFIQWEIRFVSERGRLMLLEEVAVQKWSGDHIVEERFFYEGFVDEGPVGEGF
jgi:ketosteroid isomerase-like protein